MPASRIGDIDEALLLDELADEGEDSEELSERALAWKASNELVLFSTALILNTIPDSQWETGFD